jgi:hypothetical protein
MVRLAKPQRKRSQARMGWSEEKKKDDSEQLLINIKEQNHDDALNNMNYFNFRAIGLRMKTRKVWVSLLATTTLGCLCFGSYSHSYSDWHVQTIFIQKQGGTYSYGYNHPRVVCFDHTWTRLYASVTEMDEAMVLIQELPPNDAVENKLQEKEFW